MDNFIDPARRDFDSIGEAILAEVHRLGEVFKQDYAGMGIRCLIPDFDGAIFSLEWKEALWDRFCMEAPQRLRQSVEQYRIVKRA
jgi:hypothetical protein